MKVSPDIRPGEDRGSAVRTFLIADIRGYSTFTRERGHAEAAKLAAKFVDLAGDAIEAQGGRIVEIRGDEVLAVFHSSLPAVRAGVDLQLACAEESSSDPALAVPAGMGIDAGESVRVGEQYHGSALNLAARLCSRAGAGEVLVTRTVADLCSEAADLDLAERGTAEFKGFEAPVEVIAVTTKLEPAATPASPGDETPSLPLELDLIAPMVGRDRELHWLRGTWRRVRRGQGRVVMASGPSGIGKTRLAAALAGQVLDMGGMVRYAGPGGTASADALSVLREVPGSNQPTLVVLDGFDAAGDAPVQALVEASGTIAGQPIMVLALVSDPQGAPRLLDAISGAHGNGTGHRALASLELLEVQGIARLYAGEDLAAVPMESVLRASGGIPGRVHEVMSEWARTEATRRLSAAAEYLAAGRTKRSVDLAFANNVIGLKLGRLYAVEEAARSGQPQLCPYKGLASFEIADAANFFGRERLVGELAARTVQFGLLGVVGDSGSGKSSVIAAGLLPSLRAGLLPGSDRWQHLTMRPGEHPMAELLAASRILVRDAGTDAFDQAIRSVGRQGRLVLFVDQFEELFTTCPDEDERAAFVAMLTRAATSWPDRFLAVMALRADFFGHCAAHPELAELLTGNTVLVGPMTAEDLRRAIELPARRAGLHVESSLIDALLEEVADQPGALPLLSTTLVELWQNRQDRWLRLEAYERSGGLRGAVARLAEGTYEYLSEEERQTARRIFLRLVGPGEADAITRRRAPISEFDLDQDEVARRVLEQLTSDRLLTTSGSTVEVSHEALLREWPRLRDWIDEDVQGSQLRQHLTQAARQWEISGRESSELYRGVRLTAALDWRSGHEQELNELERGFLAKGEEAAKGEAERARRTNRRLRGLLVGVAVFLVIALVAGSLALVARGQARRDAASARRQAIVADSRRLAAQAVVEDQLDRSILLALAGVRLDDSPDTRSSLLSTLLRQPAAIGRLQIDPAPGGMAISPDGRTLAVAQEQLRFFDLTTRRPIGEPIDLAGPPNGRGTAFSPDGRMLAVIEDRFSDVAEENRGFLQVIDVDAHEVRFTKSLDAGFTMDSIALSPDGRIVATAMYQVTESTRPQGWSVILWDASTGAQLRKWPLIGHEALFCVPCITGLVFLPDGKTIVSSSREGTTIFWDAVKMTRIRKLDGIGGSLGLSPDGTTLAVDGGVENLAEVQKGAPVEAGTTYLVDTVTGERRRLPERQGGFLGRVIFSPDSKMLVTTSVDQTVLVRDLPSGESREKFTLTGRVFDAVFSPDGQTLYTASSDGSVFLWDLAGGRRLSRQFSVGATNDIGWPWGASIRGPTLAVPQNDGTVPLIDVERAEKIGVLPAVHGGFTSAAVLSPDGRFLVTTGGREFDAKSTGKDGTVAFWDVSSRSVIHQTTQVHAGCGVPPRQLCGGAWAAFSPDGSMVVTTGFDGSVVVWDATTRREVHRFQVPPSTWYGPAVVFSPNGRLLALSICCEQKESGVEIWDVVSWRRLRSLTGVSVDQAGIAFSPDGRVLATGGLEGDVVLWNPATGKRIGTFARSSRALSIEGRVESVEFSPDGKSLLTTSCTPRCGASAELWDVASRKLIGHLESTVGGEQFSVAHFLPNGRQVVGVYEGIPGMLWDVELDSWQARACELAGRNLTRDEWKEVLPNQPYQVLCPAEPSG